MLKEFKDFAMRGNVIDLAVGVVIGGAFGAIVKSLVGDIIMPVIGMITGGIDFSGLAYTIGEASISYGNFVQAVFIFILTAFALFLIIKGVNSTKKKKVEAPAAPPEPAADVKLLMEIRDLLKK
ncbi:MAG: large-conductance mechanosensitive channel protein MscL [Cyclobacteriaceae bacterium]